MCARVATSTLNYSANKNKIYKIYPHNCGLAPALASRWVWVARGLLVSAGYSRASGGDDRA